MTITVRARMIVSPPSRMMKSPVGRWRAVWEKCVKEVMVSAIMIADR